MSDYTKYEKSQIKNTQKKIKRLYIFGSDN